MKSLLTYVYEAQINIPNHFIQIINDNIDKEICFYNSINKTNTYNINSHEYDIAYKGIIKKINYNKSTLPINISVLITEVKYPDKFKGIKNGDIVKAKFINKGFVNSNSNISLALLRPSDKFVMGYTDEIIITQSKTYKEICDILNGKNDIDNSKHKYYHISSEKLTKESIKDFPMFVFDIEHKDESDAMIENTKWTKPIQYFITFNDNMKILDAKKSIELLDSIDKNLLADIVSNPNKTELLNIIKKIENNANIDGITISDYSQKNYNKDADSVLIFHPNKFIKNIKPIYAV